MSLQDAKDIIALCDPLVENKFKDMIAIFLKKYQDNPMREKLKHLLLNLPVGLFLNQGDLKCVGERPMKYRDLIIFLLKRDLKQFTEEFNNEL